MRKSNIGMQRRTSSETVTIKLDRYQSLCSIRTWMAFHEIPFVIASLKPDPVKQTTWTSANERTCFNECGWRRKHESSNLRRWTCFVSNQHIKRKSSLSLSVFIVNARSRSLAWYESGLLSAVIQWESLLWTIRLIDSAHARCKSSCIWKVLVSSITRYHYLRCLLSFSS